MNFINLKLLLFLLQLLLIVVLESTPLIRNKVCYKRLLPKSIIIGVKKSGKYIFYSVSYRYINVKLCFYEPLFNVRRNILGFE